MYVSEYLKTPANEEDEVPAAENDEGDEQKDPVLEDALLDIPEVSIELSPTQASQSLQSSLSSEASDEEINYDKLLAQIAPLNESNVHMVDKKQGLQFQVLLWMTGSARECVIDLA